MKVAIFNYAKCFFFFLKYRARNASRVNMGLQVRHMRNATFESKVEPKSTLRLFQS